MPTWGHCHVVLNCGHLVLPVNGSFFTEAANLDTLGWPASPVDDQHRPGQRKTPGSSGTGVGLGS